MEKQYIKTCSRYKQILKIMHLEGCTIFKRVILGALLKLDQSTVSARLIDPKSERFITGDPVKGLFSKRLGADNRSLTFSYMISLSSCHFTSEVPWLMSLTTKSKFLMIRLSCHHSNLHTFPSIDLLINEVVLSKSVASILSQI